MKSFVTEHEWRSILDDYPSWQPTLSTSIFITPHPDDETLGAGGLIADLIAQGVDVTVISVTNGENAYQDDDPIALGAIRVCEQIKALSVLGLSEEKIIRLGIIDSAVAQSKDSLENLLLTLIDKPVNLYTTWSRDYHPDHIAVGDVAKRVAKKTHSRLINYFFWTWHLGNHDCFDSLPLHRYPLSADTVALKQKAIQCYQSQLTHVTHAPILPANLLTPLERPYEVFLPE